MVSYLHSIVTMDLSCISSKTKRDIGQKLLCFHTPAFDVPVEGGAAFGVEKLEQCGW